MYMVLTSWPRLWHLGLKTKNSVPGLMVNTTTSILKIAPLRNPILGSRVQATFTFYIALIQLTLSKAFSHSALYMWYCSYYTHTHLTALCLGLPGWAGTRKVKQTWILLKQETVSGSGIHWAICKSAPRSGQITMPAPHHSVFYRSDALLATQPMASVYWRHHCSYCYCCIWCKCKLSWTCSRQIGQWPSSA